MQLTKEQIESFNEYQESGVFHPFTCGTKELHKHSDDEDVLVAESEGLYCPSCNYRQDWAHSWMLDGSWKLKG